MRIAVVKFSDPTTFDRWGTSDEVEKAECYQCTACGYLIEETDKVIKVALLRGQAGRHWSNWVVIPTGAVSSVRIIESVEDDDPDTYDLQES